MTDLELLKSFAERFKLNVELTAANNFCATYDLEIPDSEKADTVGFLRFDFQHSNGNLVEDEEPYFVDYRENDEEALKKCLSQQDTHTKFDIIHDMLDELEWGN